MNANADNIANREPDPCLIYPPGDPIDIAPILDQLEGCTDGFCDVLGPAKGMHTNGGCKCLRWLNLFERHAAREYLKRRLGEKRKLADRENPK